MADNQCQREVICDRETSLHCSCLFLLINSDSDHVPLVSMSLWQQWPCPTGPVFMATLTICIGPCLHGNSDHVMWVKRTQTTNLHQSYSVTLYHVQYVLSECFHFSLSFVLLIYIFIIIIDNLNKSTSVPTYYYLKLHCSIKLMRSVELFILIEWIYKENVQSHVTAD